MFLFQVFLVILTQHIIHSEVVITIHILEKNVCFLLQGSETLPSPPQKKNLESPVYSHTKPLKLQDS